MKNQKITSKKLKNKKERSSFLTFCDLFPYMWEKGRKDLHQRVLWALFYLCVAKVILVLVPYLFKFSTNILLEKQQEGAYFFWEIFLPIFLVFIYNFAKILQAGFNQLRDAIFAKVGQRAVHQLAYETFIHTHKLSLHFHLQKKMGALFSVIERGTKGIEAIIRFTILNSIPTILEFILVCFVFWLSYGLSYLIVLLLTIIFYFWFTIIMSNWRIGLRLNMNKYDTQANAKAMDSFSNFETVKYFGNEEHEAKRFDESIDEYEKAATKLWVSLGWLNFGQSAILGIGMAILMVMSAYEVLRGTQTIGDFVFVNALIIQISFPLNFIGSMYREIKQGLTDIESMFSLLNEPIEIVDPKNAIPFNIQEGTIKFENISFAYDSRRQILENVSFEILKGQKVAIVGPSGSGKSTLIRLLYRFYDPVKGSIFIDGQNIRNMKQNDLRKAIAIVPQDTVLFNDTIFYNIHYGRLNASEEEVYNTAKQAQIHDFIQSLPDGYNTIAGERGLKLSGGEKQRIAIARALLKRPPILIFDEATSALDNHTESELQSAINNASQNRTTLVIAHRLSTIVNADKIIVMQKGKIVEEGEHKSLLEKKGLYYSLWERQKMTEEIEEMLQKEKEIENYTTKE